MLEARDIHKYFGTLQILKGVDLHIEAGEIVSLVGASGAGKSTLLQILGTLDNPNHGEVLFDGHPVHSLDDERKAAFRNKELGFVFQFHHLLPEFDALENVCIPGLIGKRDRREVEGRAKELLGYLGLGDRMDHKPSELSGGEQQRVAVARALVNNPRLILADEPTGNLDSQNSRNLFELFRALKEDMGVAFLITTHNETLAEESDRRLHMVDGQIRLAY